MFLFLSSLRTAQINFNCKFKWKLQHHDLSNYSMGLVQKIHQTLSRGGYIDNHQVGSFHWIIITDMWTLFHDMFTINLKHFGLFLHNMIYSTKQEIPAITGGGYGSFLRSSDIFNNTFKCRWFGPDVLLQWFLHKYTVLQKTYLI